MLFLTIATITGCFTWMWWIVKFAFWVFETLNIPNPIVIMIDGTIKMFTKALTRLTQ